MTALAFRFLVPFAGVCAAATAQAQDQQSYNAVIAAGFEVRDVAIVSLEEAVRLFPTSTTESVLVTLQNGKSVSVCYFALQTWVYLTRESLDNATLCEVR